MNPFQVTLVYVWTNNNTQITVGGKWVEMTTLKRLEQFSASVAYNTVQFSVL